MQNIRAFLERRRRRLQDQVDGGLESYQEDLEEVQGLIQELEEVTEDALEAFERLKRAEAAEPVNRYLSARRAALEALLEQSPQTPDLVRKSVEAELANLDSVELYIGELVRAGALLEDAARQVVPFLQDRINRSLDEGPADRIALDQLQNARELWKAAKGT